jgi:hypothetical protein
MATKKKPLLKRLQKTLADIGGPRSKLVPRYEPDLHDIVFSGFDMSKLPVKTHKMALGKCHTNVSRLWKKDFANMVGICTGYALSEDYKSK